jgi:outer membrane murein-binding lipoprotein Lpp
MTTIKIIKTTTIARAAVALATMMLAGSASAKRNVSGGCGVPGCITYAKPNPADSISTASGTCSCAAAVRVKGRRLNGQMNQVRRLP